MGSYITSINYLIPQCIFSFLYSVRSPQFICHATEYNFDDDFRMEKFQITCFCQNNARGRKGWHYSSFRKNSEREQNSCQCCYNQFQKDLYYCSRLWSFTNM